MKILVTGFDPFGGEKINPALEAVKAMKDSIDGVEVIKQEIPTVFHKSIKVLEEAIEKNKPDAVICVGQAGGRIPMTVERVAINLDDARIADNEGNQPIDVKVFEDGESAYFASLPIKAVVEEMHKAGVPAEVSNTAGTFVCNHIMYGLLYLIDKKYKGMKGGFIHVPFIPTQVVDKKGQPSMNLQDITKALEAAVVAIKNNDEDIKKTAGLEC